MSDPSVASPTPPRGTEDLQGRLFKLSRLVWAGGLAVALSFLALVMLGPRFSAPTSSLVTLILWVLMGGGLIVLLASAWHVVRLGRALARAAQAGQGWVPLGEVVAMIAAGLAFPAGVIGSLWLGSVALAPVITLAPALALLVVATRLRRREPRAVAAPRPGRVWLATVGFAALAVLGVGILVPVSLVGVLGERYWEEAAPNYENTLRRLRYTEAMRPYALPRDPRISPIDAGRAYHTLQGVGAALDSAGVLVTPSGQWFAEYPVLRHLEPWFDSLPPGLFDIPGGSVMIGDVDLLIGMARRGFTPAQRAYLRRLSAKPGWTEYAMVARAADMDYIGARFVLPFPDSASLYAFPIPKFAGTKEAAYASVARAAYLLSQGRADSAEVVLRETISFGFQLTDNATSLIENLIGVVIVGIGRRGLEHLYRATGQEAKARGIPARYDAATQEPAPGEGERPDAAALRARFLGAMADTALVPGLAWDAALIMSMAPCSNLRELAFGRTREVDAALAEARGRLAQTSGEAALFDMIVETPERASRIRSSEGALPKIGTGAARASGWVLANPRLAGCANLMWSAAFLF